MRELRSITFSIFLRVFQARDFPQPTLSCYFQSSFLRRRSACKMRMQRVGSRERYVPPATFLAYLSISSVSISLTLWNFHFYDRFNGKFNNRKYFT